MGGTNVSCKQEKAVVYTEKNTKSVPILTIINKKRAGSIQASEKLPTCPSPKLTLTLTSDLK